MNIIKECFDEHGGAFTESLENAGFSFEQARQFLPEAASSILDLTQDASAVQIITGLSSDGPSTLHNAINVDAIAEKLDMSPNHVTSGLEAIMPILSQAITDKGDGKLGLVSSLAGGSVDDLISSAKKLFS